MWRSSSFPAIQKGIHPSIHPIGIGGDVQVSEQALPPTTYIARSVMNYVVVVVLDEVHTPDGEAGQFRRRRIATHGYLYDRTTCYFIYPSILPSEVYYPIGRSTRSRYNTDSGAGGEEPNRLVRGAESTTGLYGAVSDSAYCLSTAALRMMKQQKRVQVRGAIRTVRRYDSGRGKERTLRPMTTEWPDSNDVVCRQGW